MTHRLAACGIWWNIAIGIGLAVQSAEPPTLPLVAVFEGQAETPSAGRLVRLDANWRLTLATSSGEREVAAEHYVHWGQWREPTAGTMILLADGGLLHCEDWRLDADRLLIPESPTGIWQAAEWPREAVRGLLLHWPSSITERDQLVERLLAAGLRQDEVWLVGGDRIQGTLRWTPNDSGEPTADPPKAASENSAGGRWLVRTQAGDIPVARDRVVAVALRGVPRRIPRNNDRPGAWLGFRDGSCLWTTRLNQRGELCELELAAGTRLTTDRVALWDELRFVQPLSGPVKYVSDLEPIGYKHIPFLSQAWDWKRDANVLGGRLRSSQSVYRKGLGMHSSARLAYDLGGQFREFQAELALDAAAGRQGSVVYRVYVDSGENEWRVAYESPTVRGGAAPLAVRVPLGGARRLALIVDFADRGDELDHANWLDARLVP